ncbi:hypothetical protein OB955_17920 [Halobacteria archaeon AArc-m2/3/4]|uniref:Uncharacterized protein n=1 Tax=Natronoglomus mannanivorans TaxID=2979990 RepID=A0ABT2QI57_9EURY|nr:hypothetical protein [Halobacteria archaeon AArc-m2/3/4]
MVYDRRQRFCSLEFILVHFVFDLVGGDVIDPEKHSCPEQLLFP